MAALPDIVHLETVEALPGIWSLAPIPALIGFILLVGIMILTGKLVPKATHIRELTTAKERGNEWKSTSDEQAVALRELRKQNADLISALSTSSAFFAAHTPRDTFDFTGGRDVSP